MLPEDPNGQPQHVEESDMRMNFRPDRAIEILERTPAVLDSLLGGISAEWSRVTEGLNTWSPYDVVGHLIHGENTDWIPRMEIILSSSPDRRFPPFDQYAHLARPDPGTLRQLLDEFASLRKANVARMLDRKLSAADLQRTGIHPEFGEVTLHQHLATWVAHDLDHISQIARTMAKHYSADVGPWVQYLKVLRQ